ncbi:E3 ubiquitin-protein ligase MBR1 [Spatholobus suberectus]|nr:E3 ubiquitin-protein ligase MBR1 [Spatholobus suberectus]
MDQMSQQRRGYFRGTNDSRPNICMVVTASGSAANLDSHYLLDDAYDNGMMYGMMQYNGIQHANLYYSGMDPSSGNAASLNHNGAYKWKNAEEFRRNHQYFNALASSSVAPPNVRHTENGIPSLPHCSSRSRSGECMMVHDHNHLIRRNYLGQHFQPAAPSWPDQQLNSNNSDGRALSWHQSPPMPYVQAPSANGSSLVNARMGLQRYHDSAGSRSGLRFPHPPTVNPQYHSFHHQTQPVQEMRGHSINFHPPVTAPSHRVPTNPSHNSSILTQNAVEMGARHVVPSPFAGARLYRPHRGNMHETTLPPMAFLQVDDVSLLVDHHSDMRLDIEDMSYEELLALGERIGNVNTGLSEEMITSQMKTKTYILPTNAINLEEGASEEQKTDSCIICQDEYKNQEKIGILQCGHEYHADCLMKWLLVKNVCPICKSEALTTGEKCV